jgi:acyl carrier protein
MEEIKIAVRQFIIENFLFEEDENLKDDTSFLESGIIDSTGVLEMVTFLEDTYEIHVEDEDMIPENLDSLESIANYITRKKNGGG